MHVLLTGCAGFIGSHVATQLLATGHSVVGLDDLNASYDPRLKHWRLDRLKAQAGFTFVPGSAADAKAVASAMARGADAVLHLAARAGVRQSTEDPAAYAVANVVSTAVVLDQARRAGIGRFALASTSSVYGGTEGVLREDSPTDRPRSPYAASKKGAEAMASAFAQLYGMDAAILRYFTVYGPAGRPDMSIFRFIRWALRGEPVLVFGDGHQERCFTYVDDVARGTVQALGIKGCHTINLGNDRPTTLLGLLQELEAVTGRKLRIEHRPPAAADVRGARPDIRKAQALLGWTPTTALRDGLRHTVDWYLANRHLADSIHLEVEG